MLFKTVYRTFCTSNLILATLIEHLYFVISSEKRKANLCDIMASGQEGICYWFNPRLDGTGC